MKRSSVVFAAALLLSATACGGGGGSTAPANSGGNNNGGNNNGSNGGNNTVPANTVIATAGDVFNPTPLTVTAGTTVTFTFESVTHNVVFTSGTTGKPADIGNKANASVTRAFTTAGTFNYTCTIHGMQGTIIVQ